MALRSHRLGNDRGAILVHVAMSLLAMMAFVAFTLDYGVMWSSRGQAQNAADAGALAGAVALAYDDSTDLSDTGPAKQNAFEATQRNLVWGEPPGVNITTDITVPITCPPDAGGGVCIKVDVYRATDHGNPLPMFFGQLFGRTSQDMRATATAQVGGANAARCMLPFILADRWADNFDELVNTTDFANDGLTGVDGWTNNDRFQPGPDLVADDQYIPPYTDEHTGWTMIGDFGRQLILHDPINQFSSGWSGIVDLPEIGSGTDVHREALWNCEFNKGQVVVAKEDWDCGEQDYPNNETTYQMGQDGCLSVRTGWVASPNEQGVVGGGPVPAGMALIEQDPDAQWSTSVDTGPAGTEGKGGVVKADGLTPNMSSPRIRPLAVMEIAEFMDDVDAGCSGSGCFAKVVNIIGFFVEGLCKDMEDAGKLVAGNTCPDPTPDQPYQLVGRIVTLEGDMVGGGLPVDESVFLKSIRLIR